MKHAFFKKAIVSACAAIVTLSMSAPAFAESFVSNQKNVTYNNISKSENATVSQKVPNNDNPGTYVVLTSKYEKIPDKFSFTGIYAATVFNVKINGTTYTPYMRFARVEATDKNGNEIGSNQVITDTPNKTSALAQVDYKKYDSSLQRATFWGDCRFELYNKTYYYYDMNCNLNFS